jgi:hypothetical protein
MVEELAVEHEPGREHGIRLRPVSADRYFGCVAQILVPDNLSMAFSEKNSIIKMMNVVYGT